MTAAIQSAAALSRPAAQTTAAPARIHALDGLRGLAACIVVLWHAFMIAEPHLLASTGGTVAHTVLTQTPVFLTLAGEEAVLVFFVLSGFAVALPVLNRGRKFSWRAYYPVRLLRLYLPAWAALAFAAVLLVLIPRTPQGDGQDWLVRTNSENLNNVPQVLGQFTLWGGGGAFPLNNPLWSLSWEIGFSLLLPLYVLVALLSRTSRWARWAALIATVGACAWGFAGGGVFLTYLPVFMLGTLLAANRDRVAEWVRRFIATTRHPRLWFGLWLAAMLECLILWQQVRFVAPELTGLIHALRVLEVLSALSLVAGAYVLGPVRRMLERKSALFAGQISFSLYLTHVPVLLAFSYLLGWELWWLALLLAIATAPAVAWVFWRWVEQPSYRLGKKVGATLAR